MILAGCSGDGIFRNLENEEKILDTNNLSSGTTLDQFLVFGDQYVINGKNIWNSTRENGSNSWEQYPHPDSYDSDRTYPSIAVLNDELYATVISHDADYRSGILKYDDAAGNWVELYHTNKISAASGVDFYRYRLYPTSQGVYLNAVRYNRDSSENSTIESSSLYFFQNNTTGAAALASFDVITNPDINRVTFTDGSVLDMPVEAIVLDSAANDVYMIYNTSTDDYDNGVLYKADGDSSFFSFSAQSTGFEGSYNYISLYYSSNHNILLMGAEADDDEHPILYKAGGAWYSVFCEDNDVQFSAFCDISGQSILAGTRAFEDPTSSSSILGNGYYEIDVTDPTAITIHDNMFSDDNNYESSDLADSTINNFYYDAAYSKVYATTYNQGLWLNIEGNWSQE